MKRRKSDFCWPLIVGDALFRAGPVRTWHFFFSHKYGPADDPVERAIHILPAGVKRRTTPFARPVAPPPPTVRPRAARAALHTTRPSTADSIRDTGDDDTTAAAAAATVAFPCAFQSFVRRVRRVYHVRGGRVTVFAPVVPR